MLLWIHYFIFFIVHIFCTQAFRWFSNKDLKYSVQIFSKNSVTSFSPMLFDVPRNQIIVGAKNMIFRLSLEKLDHLESASWTAPGKDVQMCVVKGQPEKYCHNFVEILVTNEKQLYVCGTHACKPMCQWRKLDRLTSVIETINGVGKAPFTPTANSTGLMLKTGEYFYGGPTNLDDSDFLVTKNEGPKNVMRTKQSDSSFLNEPEFAGSFEMYQFVYFVFRESAIEFMNCGKTQFSRIARVCKNDKGGPSKNTISTFTKARLNCSLSGDYPFYFNEVQGAVYVHEEDILYATFSTPVNSILGSAICAFNFSAINAPFDGSFKYQDDAGSAWEQNAGTPELHNHYTCKKDAAYVETAKFQLMDQSVQPLTVNPLHVAQLERYTHIAMDITATKHSKKMHVIFVSTNEGLLKKLTIFPKTSCVVDVYQIAPSNNIAVNNMQFLQKTLSLYITTDTQVLKMPVTFCANHTKKEKCIEARDPYCGWNTKEKACTLPPNGNPLAAHWEQQANRCPPPGNSSSTSIHYWKHLLQDQQNQLKTMLSFFLFVYF